MKFLGVLLVFLMSLPAFADCERAQDSSPQTQAISDALSAVTFLKTENSQNPEQGWVVHLSSKYHDISNPSTSSITEDGTGFVLTCVGCGNPASPDFRMRRDFLVTASHVSQGDHLNIDFGNGQAAKVTGRLADNVHDLEIIELDQSPTQPLGALAQDSATSKLHGAGSSLATLSNSAPSLTGTAFQHYSRVPHDGDFTDRLRSKMFLPSSSSVSVVKATGVTDSEKDYAFLPTVSWAAFQPKGREERLDSEAAKKRGLSQSPFSDEVAGSFDVAPGYSGAPVIRAENNVFFGSGMRIEGIVSRRNRELNQTFLVSDKTLNHLLSAYLKGGRGWTDETRWKYSGEVGTFRDLGDGSLEANLISQTTGNGLSSDGGNGVSSDGGNGVSSDGGNTNKGQRTGQPAGMIWKGKPIYGFKITLPSKDQTNHTADIYGDLAAVQLIKSSNSQITPTPIDVNTPLSSILRERLHLPEGPFTLISSESKGANESPLIIRYDGTQFHFELKTPAPIKFDLDDRAVLVPFVKVKTADGRKITLDLHELFFVDLSMIRSDERFTLSESDKQSLIETAQKTPLIRFSENDSLDFHTLTLKPALNTSEAK
jgi:hypothetical protein